MENPISIKVDYGNTAYTPGDTISGTVSWTAPEKPNKDVTIKLFYYTSGRGTKEVHVIDQAQWEGHLLEGKFSFVLPSHPPSFSGKLISITWGLEATNSSQEETALYEFTLSPTGQPIVLNTIDKSN